MSKKTMVVSTTWHNDLALIVFMKPLDSERELRNDLFWFSGHPDFYRGQEYSDEEFVEKAKKSHMYKQRKFRSWDDIPNDVSMSL